MSVFVPVGGSPLGAYPPSPASWGGNQDRGVGSQCILITEKTQKNI
jgi:hypothetical protein